MGSLGFPRTTKKISSAAPGQSPHHLVELLQAAVADQHAAAGVAMIDGHAESERVADAFLQRNGVGVLGLAGACAPRLLRLPLGHALLLRPRPGLAAFEPLPHDA